MKEVLTMWKYARMVSLVGLTTIVYAGTLVIFKAAVIIIPGVTEARPANVFPVIFGLMFGPAGAWGAAIGNIIGDVLGGTLGWGSAAGFVGNFFLGFIPYKLWGAMGLIPQSDLNPNIDSLRKLLAYSLISVISAAACAVIIAAATDWSGEAAFSLLAVVISVNNILIALVLGPPLLMMLYPRFKESGMIWTDIMLPEDVSQGKRLRLGFALMALGSLGGLAAGLGVSTQGSGQYLFQADGIPGQNGVLWTVLPFLLLILIASFMLSGREQFPQPDEAR